MWVTATGCPAAPRRPARYLHGRLPRQTAAAAVQAAARAPPRAVAGCGLRLGPRRRPHAAATAAVAALPDNVHVIAAVHAVGAGCRCGALELLTSRAAMACCRRFGGARQRPSRIARS